jgi:hypothetical protein
MRTLRTVPAVTPALVILVTGGACNSEAGPTAEDGSWQRIQGSSQRLRGYQELAPVQVGDKIVVVAGVDYD